MILLCIWLIMTGLIPLLHFNFQGLPLIMAILANETTIEGALAHDLFVAIKRLSKDLGLSFSMNLVQQFAQRFSNDLDTIRQAGFEIAVNRPKCVGHRTAAYHIT